MLVCFAVIEGMPEYVQQFLEERDVVARQLPIGVLRRDAHLQSARGESICGTERRALCDHRPRCARVGLVGMSSKIQYSPGSNRESQMGGTLCTTSPKALARCT